VMHGNQDAVVPPHLAHRTITQLQNLKMEPELKIYPMAHSLCPEQLQDIREWLINLLKHR